MLCSRAHYLPTEHLHKKDVVPHLSDSPCEELRVIINNNKADLSSTLDHHQDQSALQKTTTNVGKTQRPVSEGSAVASFGGCRVGWCVASSSLYVHARASASFVKRVIRVSEQEQMSARVWRGPSS